jgi:hypothetical protein
MYAATLKLLTGHELVTKSFCIWYFFARAVRMKQHLKAPPIPMPCGKCSPRKSAFVYHLGQFIRPSDGIEEALRIRILLIALHGCVVEDIIKRYRQVRVIHGAQG